MNKNLEIPHKLSHVETEKLKKFIRMQDWHFESLILEHCTQIDLAYLGWTKRSGEFQSINALIYGLKAINTETKESCLANFFIRYAHRVYQTYSIIEACEIIQLLKKEFWLDEYKEKLSQKKIYERQKLISQKNKVKVKNVKTTIKKVA